MNECFQINKHNPPELISDLPRLLDVPGHFHPAPFFITKDMFGGLPLALAGGHIAHLVDQAVADVHCHDVAEIYLLLSPDEGGAEIDIEVEGELFRAVSPATFYVPAKAKHRFITRKAQQGSYCLGILLENSDVETPVAPRVEKAL